MKTLLYRALRASGANSLSSFLTRRGLRILCYHGLWVTPGPQFGDKLFMSPEQFDARMRRLVESGRPVLPLDAAIERLAGNDLPPGAVVITMDDGWASTLLMADILAAHGLPATVYVTTRQVENQLPVPAKAAEYISAAASRPVSPPPVAQLPEEEWLDALVDYSNRAGVPLDWLEQRQFHLMSAGELQQAAARGMDVQLHTHYHDKQHALAKDIRRNIASLEAAGFSSGTLRHFCYPSGNVREEAAILPDLGIVSATTCVHGLNFGTADPLRLRRFLDGRRTSDAEFDAYLAGTQPVVKRAISALRSGG